MFNQIQQRFRTIPDLILTPFFTTGSTWPSYHIKPVYNDIEAPPIREDVKQPNDNVSVSSGNEGVQTMLNPNIYQQQYYQNYMNTTGRIAANIGMQPHTYHTNQMGHQYMYPTMPYYIPATKVGERVPPVVNPPQSVYNQYPQTGVAV
tara:strand:- start:41 stop:484 length:444 start_codon:yes stop_codon:yes gene_type:complete